MKLNLNCVRDVLLYLEEHLILDDDLTYHSLTIHNLQYAESLKKYPLSDIAYTVIKLEEAGFINASFQYVSGQIYYSDISSITFDGHQFLDAIRPSTTWEKICEICHKTSSFSFSAIMKIAEILLPELLESAL